MINFTVYGKPNALKRHKVFRRGKFAGSYDPNVEDKQDFLVLAHQNKPPRPLTDPLKLSLEFHFARPAAHYGTGRNDGVLKGSAPTFHHKRPDIDNLIKFVADSLVGVFWKDDACIAAVVAYKKYSERPRTEIRIEILKE